MALSLRRLEEDPSDASIEDRFLWSLEKRVDELFNDFGGSLATYVVPEMRGVFSPTIDIRETRNGTVVSAEIPGIDREDINITVHDGVLTLSGVKKVEKEEQETSYQHLERSYGCFSRNISLPDAIDSERVQAAYKNGVLTVTLPKTKKAKKESRKIPVTAA